MTSYLRLFQLVDDSAPSGSNDKRVMGDNWSDRLDGCVIPISPAVEHFSLTTKIGSFHPYSDCSTHYHQPSLLLWPHP
jgi:hypothetical protein